MLRKEQVRGQSVPRSRRTTKSSRPLTSNPLDGLASGPLTNTMHLGDDSLSPMRISIKVKAQGDGYIDGLNSSAEVDSNLDYSKSTDFDRSLPVSRE